MSIVLLIDDVEEISPVLQGALEGCDLTVKTVASRQDAKMSLLEFTPQFIFTKMALDGEDRAGLKFCQELRDHHTFSEIPVVLFVDEVSDEVSEASKHFGAKGVFPFPVENKELRRLLAAMIPELAVEVEEKAVVAKPSSSKNKSTKSSKKNTKKAKGEKESVAEKGLDKKTEPSKAKKKQDSVKPSSKSEAKKKAAVDSTVKKDKKLKKDRSNSGKKSAKSEAGLSKSESKNDGKVSEVSDNLLLAQRILATILHNLKTSDLLQVVEREDVSTVVYEMTKSVCGIRDENPAESNEVDEEESEMNSDLDRAFGLSSNKS